MFQAEKALADKKRALKVEEHRRSQLAANALKKEMSNLAKVAEANEASGKQEESADSEKITQVVLSSLCPSDGGKTGQLESIFEGNVIAQVQPLFDELMKDRKRYHD